LTRSRATASVRAVPADGFFGAAPPRRILAVKLSSFGDVVHATAGLAALRRAFPAADIRVAVERRWAPLLAACPDVDGLLEASSRVPLSPRHVWEVRRTLALACRGAGPFDLALDFQGTRRSALWIYLSGAGIKAGRGAPRPGWRATIVPDRARHAVRACADVCASIGVAAGDLDPVLRTTPRDEARVDAILDGADLPRHGFVLLNPFSVWRSKCWDERRAAELAARVAGATDVAVVLTGGDDERAPADAVVRLAGHGRVSSLAGRLALGEALCLYRRARLMVSCDSGPMHAAAALGTPVVALFGPTFPEHTGPWGRGHTVVQASRPADHHAYRRADGRQHMDALGVDAVATAVLTALDVAPAPAAVPR
jgi:heptosyltransferase I